MELSTITDLVGLAAIIAASIYIRQLLKQIEELKNENDALKKQMQG
jgi:hypothetical protein